MSKSDVAKALQAQKAAQTQGARSAPVPTNFGQGAGIIGGYAEWNFGRSFTQGLPRDWSEFLGGAFGPLAPIQPIGIDNVDPSSGRPEPRRFQYPVGWNMPIGTPGSEGLKLVSFANLRAYADTYSVVRACIQVRKEEILGLEWDIVPTDEAAREMRGDSEKHSEFQERRREALKFFRRPDPNYHDFSGWLGAVLEDVLVVDALSIYMHPSRGKGKGLLGSDLAALEILDGTTIRPLLSIKGETPRPPNVAFQQYLWGVPRTDLMDIILEADLEQMDEPVAEYTGSQLLYLPYNRRSWTPYGFPGIERAIIPVMTGLRRQQFQLEFYSEGTIPGQFIIPGDDITTPQQIRMLQDTLNAIAGDQAWKHKIIVLPRGSKTQPQKPIDLASQFDDTIMTMICMAYDVMPMELGISPSTSASQSSGAASQMAKASQEISQRKALKPMLQWLKGAIFDHVLQDVCRQNDMQWVWTGLQDAHDEEQQASNFKTLIGAGMLSIDEARSQMGLNPWGLPLTSDPVYMSATGISTLGIIDPAAVDTALGQPVVDPNTLGSQPTTFTPVAMPGMPGAPSASAGAQTSVGTPGVGGRPQGGGGGAPSVVQPAAGTSTPLHDNGGGKPKPDAAKATEKAALSELDSLRRHLKKGDSLRRIRDWDSEFISAEALEAASTKLANGADINKAIASARTVIKSERRINQRREVITSTSATVAEGLGLLAAHIRNPQVGPIGFIDRGTRLLAAAYLDVYNEAARHAAEHYSHVSPAIPNGFDQKAQDRADAQRNFLMGMSQAVLSNESPAKTGQRINLYARSLQPVYEEGYGLAVLTGTTINNSTAVDSADETINDGTMTAPEEGDNQPSVPVYVEDFEPDLDGEEIVLDGSDIVLDEGDLAIEEPFANYQSEVSADDESWRHLAELGIALGVGGLILSNAYDSAQALDENIADAVDSGTLDDTAMPNASDSSDISSDAFDTGTAAETYDVPPRGAIIWHTTSDNPCDHCAGRDGEEYTMDTLPCWPGDGLFGEFCDGAANCNCYLEYVNGDEENLTGPNYLKDYSNLFYQQRAADENYFDQQAIDQRLADIAAVAEVDPAAAARMEQRDALHGVRGTRFGPSGLYSSTVVKFDPEQPRDEHGRWASSSGGIGVSEEQGLAFDRMSVTDYAEHHGWQKANQEDVAKTLAKNWWQLEYKPGQSGDWGSVDSHTMGEDARARAISKELDYLNGVQYAYVKNGVVVGAMTDSGATDAQVKEALLAVDALSEVAPKPDTVVLFMEPSNVNPGTLATSIIGDNFTAMWGPNLKDANDSWDSDLKENSEKPESNLALDPGVVSVMAHEWGHLLDEKVSTEGLSEYLGNPIMASFGFNDSIMEQHLGVSGVLQSVYGGSNASESHAEAFADWVTNTVSSDQKSEYAFPSAVNFWAKVADWSNKYPKVTTDNPFTR